jgi:uncharacterized membrane protein
VRLPPTKTCARCWQFCAAALERAWRTPPPARLRPAAHALEFAITSLPLARRALAAVAVAFVCLELQLCWREHFPAAAALLLVVAAAVMRLRHTDHHDPASPRRVLLAADGRIWLFCVGGAAHAATAGGESIWLGANLLLVLHGTFGCRRLLLGPGNLDPATLAALRRRLLAARTPDADCARLPASRPPGAGSIEQITR